MSQSSSNVSVLGDPLMKAAFGMAALFILGLIVIELMRDEDSRAGTAGAGAPAGAMQMMLVE